MKDPKTEEANGADWAEVKLKPPVAGVGWAGAALSAGVEDGPDVPEIFEML